MDSKESAQVLSKKQKKQAINASKKAPEKSLRNVITHPYEKYWPEIDEQKESSFIDLLQKSLQKLKVHQESLPLSSLKGKSNAEKKQLKCQHKQERESSEGYKEAMRLRGAVLLGVNAVSRGLETGVVSAALVTGDADPQLMVEHLVQLAGMKRVPVLIVPALRSTCCSALGFSCVAVALKNAVNSDPDHHLHALLRGIEQLSSQFSVPKPLCLFASTPSPLKDNAPLAVKVEKLPLQSAVHKHHLKRPVGGGRAFVPSGSQSKSDFISLGGSDDMNMATPEVKPLREKKTQYEPLVVKRLKPNPHKVSKKKKSKDKRQ